MKKLKALVRVVLSALLLTGCDFDIYKLPLPGGPDAGDNPMTVTVQFADVLDLVPKSTVKVNDVSVGTVTDVDSQRLHRRGHPRDAQRRRAARQRGGRDPADQPARREVRLPQGPRRRAPATNPLESGDEIPLERSRAATPRSRRSSVRSACCSTAAGSASSRRSPRSSTSPSRVARVPPGRCCSRSAPSWASSTRTRPTSSPRSRSSTGSRSRSARSSRPSTRPSRSCPARSTRSTRQTDDLVKMLEALDDLSEVGVEVIPPSKAATIDSPRGRSTRC